MNEPDALTAIGVNLTNMKVICAFNKRIVIRIVVAADSACSDP
jgi:hypothetical protein